MINMIDQLLVGHQVHEEEHLLEPRVRIDEYDVGEALHLVLAADGRRDAFFVEIPQIDVFALSE